MGPKNPPNESKRLVGGRREVVGRGSGVVGPKNPPNESLRLVGWCREVMGWGTGVVGPKKPPNESKRLVGGVEKGHPASHYDSLGVV